MKRDPRLKLLRDDCPLCFGENLYYPRGSNEPEGCPWCNPIIEAVYGKPPDRPPPNDDEPIPF